MILKDTLDDLLRRAHLFDKKNLALFILKVIAREKNPTADKVNERIFGRENKLHSNSTYSFLIINGYIKTGQDYLTLTNEGIDYLEDYEQLIRDTEDLDFDV